MDKCVACNSRVEDGATRCSSCGASLVKPAAFMQTLGFIIIGLSTIPFGVAWIAAEEGSGIPMAVAAGVLAIGIIMVIVARAKNKAAPPAVVPEEKSAESIPPTL